MLFLFVGDLRAYSFLRCCRQFDQARVVLQLDGPVRVNVPPFLVFKSIPAPFRVESTLEEKPHESVHSVPEIPVNYVRVVDDGPSSANHCIRESWRH